MPRGPQAFTYYSQDVPAYVASLFRVRPVGWGAMGDSTGGYCASKLAVTNSYVFPAAVALSGYAAPPQDLTTGDLFGGGASLRAQSDLVHLPRTGHSPAASLLLTTTRTERGPSGLEAVWTLQRAARPPLQGSRPAAGTASARGARGFRPCWPGSPPTCTRAHRDRLRCAAGRRAPCSSRRWRRERPLTPALSGAGLTSWGTRCRRSGSVSKEVVGRCFVMSASACLQEGSRGSSGPAGAARRRWCGRSSVSSVASRGGSTSSDCRPATQGCVAEWAT